MQVTDDDVLGLLAAPRRSRDSCPTADRLAAAAEGRLPDAERDGVLDHLGRCADCAEEMRALSPLTAWSTEAAMRLAAGRRRRPVRPAARWTSWAAAAALALALSSLLVPLHRGPVLRTRRAALLRSLLPEAGAVPRDACRLRWSDAGGGARYAVNVLSKDLRPLAAALGLERPEYVVAPAALRPVPSGGEIVWSVEARWPDGRRLASPTFVTRVQ